MNDKVMKFVSYANTSMKRIRSTSPKSAVASQNILTGGSSGSSNSASGGDDINYDAPSLANAVGSSAKVGSFAQRIRAQKAGAAAGTFGRGLPANRAA